MEATTITFRFKGKVVIPAVLRRKFGIRDGSKASVIVTSDGILLRPLTRPYIHGLRGSLKGCGVLKALMDERRCARSPL